MSLSSELIAFICFLHINEHNCCEIHKILLTLYLVPLLLRTSFTDSIYLGIQDGHIDLHAVSLHNDIFTG